MLNGVAHSYDSLNDQCGLSPPPRAMSGVALSHVPTLSPVRRIVRRITPLPNRPMNSAQNYVERRPVHRTSWTQHLEIASRRANRVLILRTHMPGTKRGPACGAKYESRAQTVMREALPAYLYTTVRRLLSLEGERERDYSIDYASYSSGHSSPVCTRNHVSYCSAKTINLACGSCTFI